MNVEKFLTLGNLKTPGRDRVVAAVRAGKFGPNMPHIYIGRAMPSWELPCSPLGNPFREGQNGTRDEVIEKFYNYIAVKVAASPEKAEIRKIARTVFRQMLLAALGEPPQAVTLWCWCVPQRCHGEIIRAMVRVEVTSRKDELEEIMADIKRHPARSFVLSVLKDRSLGLASALRRIDGRN